MSSIVHFGIVPSKTQIVSDDAKAKNLNFLRVEPSKVTVSGGPTVIQPGYATYRSFLPLFMSAGMNGTRVPPRSSPFVGLAHKNLPYLDIPFPRVAISWNVTIAEEVRQGLRGKGWRDGMIRGKPVMLHDKPNSEIVRDAMATGCLRTTPTNEGTINIFAFIRCVVIARIAATFFRINQYPAFVDEDHTEEFSKQFEGPETEVKGMGEDVEAENTEQDVPMEDGDTSPSRSFRVNLLKKPEEYPIFYDEHSAPEGAGLLFKFDPVLTKFDRVTIIQVIDRYFYGCLATSKGEAAQVYADLVSAMGNITNTFWGDAYAHIYKIIDIALRTQTQPIVMMTANNYDGIFLRGAGYHITINGVDREASPAAQVKADMPNLDTHANALWLILQKLRFLTDEDRLSAFRTIKTMRALKQRVDDLEMIGGVTTREEVLKTARFLSFPEDIPLEPTAANIAFALSFLSDGSKDLHTLPYMYYKALFTTDRLAIVMSAFGSVAPSFRVPGGKVMQLSAKFRVSDARGRAEKGPTAHRDVSKVAAVLIPYDEAVAQMKIVLKEKTIWNPFGNANANASASHMNKIYEGESCTKIVEALRGAAQVTVVDESTSRKRDREEVDVGGRPSKRGRIDEDF